MTWVLPISSGPFLITKSRYVPGACYHTFRPLSYSSCLECLSHSFPLTVTYPSTAMQSQKLFLDSQPTHMSLEVALTVPSVTLLELN